MEGLMIRDAMNRRLDQCMPAWLGLRRCPWCKNRTLVIHTAAEPWRTRVERGITVIHGTPWFRCGHCGQDGTLEFLYYTVFPDAPEPETTEAFRRLFQRGVWDKEAR
jgi:YgiT-type zinc finger domain-containing protein